MTTEEKSIGYRAAQVLSPDLVLILHGDNNRLTDVRLLNGKVFDIPNAEQLITTIVKNVPLPQLLTIRPELYQVVTPQQERVRAPRKYNASKNSLLRKVGDNEYVLIYGYAALFTALWKAKEEWGDRVAMLSISEVMELMPEEALVSKDQTYRARLNSMFMNGLLISAGGSTNSVTRVPRTWGISQRVLSVCPYPLDSDVNAVLVTLKPE